MGAAYLAGLAVGFWQNLDELQEKAVIEREFRPGIETTERNYQLRRLEKSGRTRDGVGRTRPVNVRHLNQLPDADRLMRRLRVLSASGPMPFCVGGIRRSRRIRHHADSETMRGQPRTHNNPTLPLCYTSRHSLLLRVCYETRTCPSNFPASPNQRRWAGYKWLGRGDKNTADGAAVNAMRIMLNQVNIDGTIVIGEGEIDEAPMLYIGEKVGTGRGDAVDIAVDPIEGTRMTAMGQANALAVLAVGDKGCFLNAPDMYMEKLISRTGSQRHH